MPDDDEFHFLEFDKDLYVAPEVGLGRNFSPGPLPRIFDLSDKQPGEGHQLGRLIVGQDGGLLYKPDQRKWDEKRNNNPNYLDIDDNYDVKFNCGAEVGLIKVSFRYATAKLSSRTNHHLNENQTGYIVFGGGDDHATIIEHMSRKAGTGRLVILSASGRADSGFIDSVLKSPHRTWKDVISFVVNSRALAESPEVSESIGSATAIFIEGGNQTKYWNCWNDTGLHLALEKRRKAGVLIAGSSAGMALLGSNIYLPPTYNDGIRSIEAMANPQDPRLAFDGPFLKGVLKNSSGKDLTTVMETHFGERQRMGRALIFLQKCKAQLCIMADEDTGLWIDTKFRRAEVVGKSYVYLAVPETGNKTTVYKLRSGTVITNFGSSVQELLTSIRPSADVFRGVHVRGGQVVGFTLDQYL